MWVPARLPRSPQSFTGACSQPYPKNPSAHLSTLHREGLALPTVALQASTSWTRAFMVPKNSCLYPQNVPWRPCLLGKRLQFKLQLRPPTPGSLQVSGALSPVLGQPFHSLAADTAMICITSVLLACGLPWVSQECAEPKVC